MCPTPRSEAPVPGSVAAAAQTVRSVLHRLGYRFRLRGGALPGCPEVVLPRWRMVLLVVDCAGHPHPGCVRAGALLPATMAGLEAARRLEQAEAELGRQGWRTLVVQACEADDAESLGRRLDIALQERLIATAAPGAADSVA